MELDGISLNVSINTSDMDMKVDQLPKYSSQVNMKINLAKTNLKKKERHAFFPSIASQ